MRARASARRRHVVRVTLALLALCCAPHGRAGAAAAPSPGAQCVAAIGAAEQQEAIPGHLLAAIGLVESGRRDAATDRWMPWPWAIDVNGQDSYFSSAAEAIAAVGALQARGVHSIDVGCVQINLAQHPDAFETLDRAFDPVANVTYGAQFLRRLYAATGNWTTAVGFYHSSTPSLAEPYVRRVRAIAGNDILLDTPGIPRPKTRAQTLAAAWAATVESQPAADPGFSFHTVGAGRGAPAPGVQVAQAAPKGGARYSAR
jgi:hypothetical protein